MYALKHIKTGKIMGYWTIPNPNNPFCVSVSFGLSFYRDNVWVVNSRDVAEQVVYKKTPWENASYDSPMNIYVGQLVVVELVEKSQE